MRRVKIDPFRVDMDELEQVWGFVPTDEPYVYDVEDNDYHAARMSFGPGGFGQAFLDIAVGRVTGLLALAIGGPEGES